MARQSLLNLGTARPVRRRTGVDDPSVGFQVAIGLGGSQLDEAHRRVELGKCLTAGLCDAQQVVDGLGGDRLARLLGSVRGRLSVFLRRRLLGNLGLDERPPL